jgi:manganese transport protein
VAASLFHRHGLDVRTLHEAYGGFKHLAGGLAALAFALALLASGLSSASVGTFAGQVVMQGFVARTIPIVLRRLMTMLPSLVILEGSWVN